MMLKTLLEYQRCYELLRDCENAHARLRPDQYMECLRAKAMFDYELSNITKNIDVMVKEAA